MGLLKVEQDHAREPRRYAQAFRWGIVLVAAILTPGVAFLGQGIGQWLRSESVSPWSKSTPAIQAVPSLTQTDDAPKLASRDDAPRPPLAESAAMYDGGRGNALHPTQLASFHEGAQTEAEQADLVQAAYRTSDSQFEPVSLDGFAELEAQVQSRGAVYYALEADLHAERAYRFICVMASQTGNGAEEKFEARGRTPLEAIQAVIRQLPAAR